MNWKEFCKKPSCSNLINYFCICLKELRKTTKHFLSLFRPKFEPNPCRMSSIVIDHWIRTIIASIFICISRLYLPLCFPSVLGQSFLRYRWLFCPLHIIPSNTFHFIAIILPRNVLCVKPSLLSFWNLKQESDHSTRRSIVRILLWSFTTKFIVTITLVYFN
jgi:hypothetical protein